MLEVKKAKMHVNQIVHKGIGVYLQDYRHHGCSNSSLKNETDLHSKQRAIESLLASPRHDLFSWVLLYEKKAFRILHLRDSTPTIQRSGTRHITHTIFTTHYP